ncbi:MAG: ribulose-phosphate 3-epimerase [Chitinispirillaceae bacterium]|nr:ribulose-phosphate 3-epimerase [Chitinispirillaceae bacterium]
MTPPPLADLLTSAPPQISAGMISANLMNLTEDVRVLADAGVHLLHFDVMDGCFCPALTAGPFFVNGIKTKQYKDVHLMVADPLPLIPEFAAAGADIITVHVESGRYPHRALQCIGEQKNGNDPSRPILRGIALNPGTPLAQLEPLIDLADLIVVLAVNPGFSGQRFDESICRKFKTLTAMLSNRERKPFLEIDGGITKSTVEAAAALKPHCIVTGSALFENGRIRENVIALQSVLDKG